MTPLFSVWWHHDRRQTEIGWSVGKWLGPDSGKRLWAMQRARLDSWLTTVAGTP